MDRMLEELEYTIDLSENETKVNRTEEETNISINITEPESEFLSFMSFIGVRITSPKMT